MLWKRPWSTATGAGGGRSLVAQISQILQSPFSCNQHGNSNPCLRHQKFPICLPSKHHLGRMLLSFSDISSKCWLDACGRFCVTTISVASFSLWRQSTKILIIGEMSSSSSSSSLCCSASDMNKNDAHQVSMLTFQRLPFIIVYYCHQNWDK